MVRKLQLNASVGKVRMSATKPGENTYTRSMKASFKNILKNFQKVIDWTDQNSADILIDALAPTFEKAKDYTPVDTGRLKASGYLEKDTTTKIPRVVIGFGYRGNPDYASFVHERVDIPHKAPTRAKFLSSALEEDQVEIQKRIVLGYAKGMGVR